MTPEQEPFVEDQVPEHTPDDAVENPADLLTDALNNEVTAEELTTVDDALGSMGLGEASAPELETETTLLSLEEAQAQLAPGILDVLAEKFKGSLTRVRHPDAQDQIF